jgi:predicted DNA-binding protein (UPF0251 family)
MPDDRPSEVVLASAAVSLLLPASATRYPHLCRLVKAHGAQVLKARPKECRRFRALCLAIGFRPPADLKPEEQEAWWLLLYSTEDKFPNVIWDMILREIEAGPRLIVEAAAKAALEWAKPKTATIVRQAEEITRLIKQVRVRPRRRKRGGKTIRPLTDKQAEALFMLGLCNGNYAEAARRIGIDRKSFEERCKAAYGKLGRKGMKLQEIEFNKALVARLPRDRRGQEAVAVHDDGPAALEGRKPQKVTRNRRG